MLPSQSLSMPSQVSVQPPGSVAQSAFTALHWVAEAPLHVYVPVVRQAPCPGTGAASSLAQGCPKFETFSLTMPSQSLSRASHVSSLGEQPPTQTPAGNEQFQLPPTQVTLTPVVHSGRFALGLTPQTCTGDGAVTLSSMVPLQLSSTPLQASVAEMYVHAYSHCWSPLRSK